MDSAKPAALYPLEQIGIQAVLKAHIAGSHLLGSLKPRYENLTIY